MSRVTVLQKHIRDCDAAAHAGDIENARQISKAVFTILASEFSDYSEVSKSYEQFNSLTKEDLTLERTFEIIENDDDLFVTLAVIRYLCISCSLTVRNMDLEQKKLVLSVSDAVFPHG